MVLAQPESMGNQGVRLAVEDQYGVLNPDPTWRLLNDVKIVPKPQFETDPFVPSGHEIPTTVILNDDFTNLDVTGRLSYTSLMYILSSLFGYPTTTLVEGSTYDHEWVYDGRTAIQPASFTVDYGTAAGARRVLGSVFNGLTAGVARTGLEFGSSGFGKDLQTIPAMGGQTNEVQTITITGTPTSGTFTLTHKGQTTDPIQYNANAAAVAAALNGLPNVIAGSFAAGGGGLPATPVAVTFQGRLGGLDQPILTADHTLSGGTSPDVTVTATTPGADAAVDFPAQPIFPLHFDIFAGDSWTEAETEVTKLLALYNYSLGIAERLDRSRPVNRLRTSDNLFIREDQDHTIGLRMGVDAVAEAMYETVRNGAKKFIKAHAIGPNTGDGTNKYEFETTACMLLTGTDGYDTESGLHVMTWNGRIARDTVSGNAVTFRLRNRQSGL